MSCTARTWRSRAAPRPQARSRKGTRKTRAPAKVRAARAALRFTQERGTRRPARRLQDRVRDVALVGDRKSTRLNSSHSQISYAVFCLKKKNMTTNPAHIAQSHL